MGTAENIGKAQAGDLPNAEELKVCHVLAAEMKAVLASQRCTKRTAARLAISNAIRSKVLKPGDYLPSELALTKVFDVSLGTVQAALLQLRDVGLIIRRRGDGTRVAAQEPLAETVWHFRFQSRESGKPLRIAEESIQLETVDDAGFWSDHLGADRACYRITRRLQMLDGTRAGADMYLPCSLASGLDTVDINELMMTNIRPFLEERLNLKVTGREHLVTTVMPDAQTLKTYQLTSDGPYYEIHARTWSSDSAPVYHQRILVAVCDCNLKF
ncbi:GntR family transcriptional regulator [Hoeflea poritis]|uniref:GntR family transcriptional regulator n=1 Tax=Hoeflea poritis TaxID=2993659 RepID=A0ABT4VK19_9HYPH|nr:GntR family transcriptional regulator [Hoeflea poritis]MDA4845059.1 GntR family transcriptional regulator [Hoeflea poritis]